MNKAESESLIITIIWREEETKCPVIFLSYSSKNMFYVLTRKVFINLVEMSNSFKHENFDVNVLQLSVIRCRLGGQWKAGLQTLACVWLFSWLCFATLDSLFCMRTKTCICFIQDWGTTLWHCFWRQTQHQELLNPAQTIWGVGLPGTLRLWAELAWHRLSSSHS